mmetsp:Transcript_5617/g.11146  ORF Transcript_5617/g.11146 Transcript_5617/m.11146 type:complete len:210 (+) Transcript_5617:766-1395(+)
MQRLYVELGQDEVEALLEALDDAVGLVAHVDRHSEVLEGEFRAVGEVDLAVEVGDRRVVFRLGQQGAEVFLHHHLDGHLHARVVDLVHRVASRHQEPPAEALLALLVFASPGFVEVGDQLPHALSELATALQRVFGVAEERHVDVVGRWPRYQDIDDAAPEDRQAFEVDSAKDMRADLLLLLLLLFLGLQLLLRPRSPSSSAGASAPLS